MTRDQWSRVKEIVAAALAQPESARAAYLATQCDSDDALRREAESLLA